MATSARSKRSLKYQGSGHRLIAVTSLRRVLGLLTILVAASGMYVCKKPTQPTAVGPIILTSAPLVAVQQPSAPQPLTTVQIVARVDPSVALIRGKRALGTGFLARTGLLATNAHVIEGEVISNLEVRFPAAGDSSKGPLHVELAFKDPKRDLAFLRVKTDLPPLEIAQAYQFQKGDDVLIIGNPGVGTKLVLENAISRGVMSTRTTLDGQPFYQLGIAINPGNSGGPVIDLAGKVIGVASRKATQLEGTAFCIPVEDLRAAMAKVESRPQTAAAGATPAQASGLELRYGWKPGQAYVYAVHVAYQVGKKLVTMDGSSIYKVKASDKTGATLAHRGWLITRKRSKDQASGSGDVTMPGGPASAELKMNVRGNVEDARGALPIPLLGDLSLLVIESLPEEKLAQWDEVKTVSLLETQVTPGGGVIPFRFGRPSLAERMMESRLRGRLGVRPRLGIGPRIGVRPGLRGSPRLAPAPAAEVKVTSHPARERTEYALGSTSGEIVSITKAFELKSEENVGDEPVLLMTGTGTFSFNIKEGIPTALEFTAKVTENSENMTLRVPIELSCKLLEGAERALALRFPVLRPTAMNPLSEPDVTSALADLRSSDNGRKTRAAARLRDGAPIEARRAEVAQALNALLAERDGFVRNAVIQAVGVWGDATSAPLLLEHLNDDRYGSRGELLDALARLQPDEHTARAMVGWLAKDTGAAGRVLRAMGPAAEPALLAFLSSDAQTQLRVEACHVLKDIGTGRSLPLLRELSGKSENEELGRVAGDVARKIEARHLNGNDLSLVVASLGASNVGQRRDAAQRLLAAAPVASRRAEVSAALVQHLSEPDNETQKQIIRGLGSWGDEAAAKALVERLRDPAFLFWREAVESLGKIGRDGASAQAIALRVKQDRGLVLRALATVGPPAEPVLIELVQSQEDWGTRSDACKLLGEIGSKACIPVLQEATRNRKDPFVVMAAEGALKKLDTAPSNDVTLTLLRLTSTNPDWRRDAIRALAEARPDPVHCAAAARALEAALNDRDENLQRDALRALRAWGDRSSAPALIDRCKDRSFNPWREALEVLAQLDPSPQTADLLIARMPDDYGHILRLLHTLGPAAEPALLQAFQNSPDLRVRVESCKVLESAGTERSLPVLQAFATRTGDGAIAAAAAEALRGISERE